MDEDKANEIRRLEALARAQDRYASENAAKGEPKYNLHSALADQYRGRARAIRLANKRQLN